eukprot:TRINITY_DN7588_c0_g1_i3.p1 TRINITY_DN7588_c0_g1~~TRINITY_DN7588_c0_g1_i3.p1  ORF type:complete len:335 (-),score=69.20 TRINITY_DN7588_c0_g1_i3:458-1462(-)
MLRTSRIITKKFLKTEKTPSRSFFVSQVNKREILDPPSKSTIENWLKRTFQVLDRKGTQEDDELYNKWLQEYSIKGSWGVTPYEDANVTEVLEKYPAIKKSFLEVMKDLDLTHFKSPEFKEWIESDSVENQEKRFREVSEKYGSILERLESQEVSETQENAFVEEVQRKISAGEEFNIEEFAFQWLKQRDEAGELKHLSSQELKERDSHNSGSTASFDEIITSISEASRLSKAAIHSPHDQKAIDAWTGQWELIRPKNTYDDITRMKVDRIFMQFNLHTYEQQIDFLDNYELSMGDYGLEWVHGFPPPPHTYDELPLVKEYVERDETLPIHGHH